MRVKLFSKYYPWSPSELYKDGLFKRLSFRNVKDVFFGKNEPPSPNHALSEGLSLRNAQDLEDEINAWLSQNPKIKVVDIQQSASGGTYAPSLWLVSVWYEEAG